ncbi:hypothetical protein [Desulfoluna sp.]|uniref:fibronectin type III domain-containing protein n=1 Tax=Desulfoluna sp. TaxID=2045199 RepID=UPI0026026781|nr:hypothetical protein [Desulfoluna sp.]
MTRLFLSFLLLCAPSAMAADAFEAPSLVLLTKVTREGVRLKWVPTDKRTDCTYTLTRTEPGALDANGQQVPATPLGTFRMKTQAELQATLPEETMNELIPLLFPQSLYKTDFEKLRILAEEENRKGMLFFLAETRKDLMEILGITHTDPDVVSPKNYLYTVTASHNGTVIASASKLVKTNRFTPMNTPQATAVRYGWGAALKWTNFRTYAAFHIYRASTEKGPFTRITKTPVGVNYQVNEARQMITPPWFHTDPDLDPARIYYYRVTGIDSFGDESPQSPSAFAITDAARRPAPLGAVSTTPGDREVTLGWTPKEKGLTYNLYRGYRSNGTFRKLNNAPLTEPTYTDTGLVYGQDYFYSVTGVRNEGTESLMSPPAHVPCRDLVPPPVPTGIRAVSKAGEVILEWNAVSDEALSGYSVYRAYAADAPDWTRLTSAPQAPLIFVDSLSKAFDKQSFFYKVCAADIHGNISEWSDTLKIKLPDVTAPLAPVWSDWSQNKDSVTLTWRPSKAPDVEGYLLYRGKGNRKKRVTPKALATTQFTDSNVTEGATLTYHLVAVDTAGNHSPDSSPLTVHLIDTTPPVIESLTLTLEKGRVVIHAALSGNDFKGMSVQRKRTDQKEFKTIRSMARGTTWTDKRINPGRHYTYRVIAYDRAGNASTGKFQSVTIPD